MTNRADTETIVLETESHDHLISSSLVLSAVDISHTISTLNGKHILLVPKELETDARYQLETYFSENKDWPPAKKEDVQVDSPIQPPTLLIIGALVLFYTVTGPWSEHSKWFQLGAGDATSIKQGGEYFRLITALTLHADITHLLGNCFLGGFIVHFFCKSTGPGIGFAAILTAAVMGNFINVHLHGGDHHFVGFSTAVFATIGMLSMLSYDVSRRLNGYHMFVPFMAGAALLAMTGSSGERTDLGAHLFGLLSGFLIGRILILKSIRKLRSSSSLQFILFIATVLLIYLSWDTAMSKGF